MSADTLETLLRQSRLTHGRICLTVMPGRGWYAGVSHFHTAERHGHMTSSDPGFEEDPVAALRVALIEDERLSRDLERRYRAAPKLGAASDADIDDLLG